MLRPPSSDRSLFTKVTAPPLIAGVMSASAHLLRAVSRSKMNQTVVLPHHVSSQDEKDVDGVAQSRRWRKSVPVAEDTASPRDHGNDATALRSPSPAVTSSTAVSVQLPPRPPLVLKPVNECRPKPSKSAAAAVTKPFIASAPRTGGRSFEDAPSTHPLDPPRGGDDVSYLESVSAIDFGPADGAQVPPMAMADAFITAGVSASTFRVRKMPMPPVLTLAQVFVRGWNRVLDLYPDFAIPIHAAPPTLYGSPIDADHFCDPPVALEYFARMVTDSSRYIEPMGLFATLVYFEKLAKLSTALAADPAAVLRVLRGHRRVRHHILCCAKSNGVPTSALSYDSRFPITTFLALFKLSQAMFSDWTFDMSFFKAVLPAGYFDHVVASHHHFTPMSGRAIGERVWRSVAAFDLNASLHAQEFVESLRRVLTFDDLCIVARLSDVFS
jgi:hypothetical protein